MRKIALAFVVLAALTLAACGSGGGSAPNTVTMGATTFVTSSLTVKSGTSVTFNDPKDSGGTHNIVPGTNGTFTAEPGVPAAFTATGIMFNAGDSQSFVFATPGTYTFTCTIHPTMLVTITVTS